MSISTTSTKDSYSGNNSTTTPYPITFKYLESSHLTVYVDNVEISDSYYTLTGDGTTGTGQFTTALAYPSTKSVVVVLDVPLDQPTALQETGALPAKTLEESFDRLNMQIRRVWRKVQNTLTFSTDEGGTGSQGTPNTFLGFDSSGTLTDLTNFAGTTQGVDRTYDIQATGSDDLVTPDARGEGSVDLQTKRSLATHIAGGLRSALLGGADNMATNAQASVVGGSGNRATSINSAVIGGEDNTAGGGNDSGVFCGRGSTASNSLAVVVGALESSATGGRSSCLGGEYNNAVGNSSTVVGGKNGTTNGVRSIVVGGQGCTTDGDGASIIGGKLSSATGDNASILGGNAHSSVGDRSVILGGDGSSTANNNAAVLAGFGSQANGLRSCTLGGSSNIATGSDSIAAGLKARSTLSGSRVFADSQDTFFVDRQANEFAIQASALRLEDGNEGVGKVLTCNHADGSSNWSAPKLPVYTFSTLPSSPALGEVALITDSNTTTYHAVASGGGIHVIPVYFSGGSWRIG